MNLPGIVQVNTQIPSALDRFYARQQMREQTKVREHQMAVQDRDLALQEQESQQRAQQLQQKADEVAKADRAQRDQANSLEVFSVLRNAPKTADGKVDRNALMADLGPVVTKHGGGEGDLNEILDMVEHNYDATVDMVGFAALGDNYTPTKPAEAPKPVELNEGARLVDPVSGKTIAEGNPKTFAPKDAKREIRTDQNGVNRYVDDGSEVFPGIKKAGDGSLPPEGADGAEVFDERQSLWQAAESGTGAGGLGRDVFSSVVGQVGISAAEKTTESRRDLASSMGTLIEQMALNKRYPVAEMKMLQKRYPLDPSISMPTPKMHAAMRSMNGELIAQWQKRAAVVADPNPSIDEETRLDAATQAAALHNFILRLGVPPKKEPGAKFKRIVGDTSVWQRKDGTYFKYDGLDVDADH